MRLGGCSAVALISALGGCGQRATPAECVALLDRYVELLVRQEDPGARPVDIDRAKAQTRARAAVDPAFLSCEREVRQHHVACAVAAPTVDEFEKCMQ
jgi:hypothetical protein